MLFKNKKIKEELRLQREAEASKAEEIKRREKELELERMEREAELRRIEEERRQANPVSKYKFSEPEPRPKELISVLKRMLQKTFPDAKKAFLLLTSYEDKSGYLLVVDIDSRFLKIINLYLDGETKRVRNSMPIECILYSDSGSLTSGIKPFYEKQMSEAEIMRSQREAKQAGGDTEAASDIVFADMPEFGVQGNLPHDDKYPAVSSNDSKPVVEEPVVEEPVVEEPVVEEPVVEEPVVEEPVVEEPVVEEPVVEEPVVEEPVVEEPAVEEPAVEEAAVEEPAVEEAAVEEPVVEEPVVEEPVVEGAVAEEPAVEESVVEGAVSEETVVREVCDAKPSKPEKQIKVKPENKKELFAILNEYGLAPTDASFAVANAAIKEYKFFIPYVASGIKPKGLISDSFPEGKKISLVASINVKSKIRAVSFFTQKEDALEFGTKQECDFVCIKYKSFKKAYKKGVLKLDSFDGIIINPGVENVFLPCDYPLI